MAQVPREVQEAMLRELAQKAERLKVALAAFEAAAKAFVKQYNPAKELANKALKDLEHNS